MKLSIILFSCICLIACSISNKPDDRFYSIDGRFKVSFPISPTIKNEIVKSTYGDYVYTTFFSKKNESERYFTSYAVFEYTVKTNEDKKLLLEEAKNNLLNQLEIDLSEERDTIINDYFGNIFKASDSNYFIEILQLADNNRIFQVGIMKNEAAPSEQDFSELIDSFEIIKAVVK